MSTPTRPLLGAGRSISRRGFIGGAGATAILLGTGVYTDPVHATTPQRHGLSDYPFTLGVASGDPLPDSVVLWTRLAPDPYAVDGLGGMPPMRIPVHWQVAEDEQFRRIVKRGVVHATPELNHSVHPEVWGLRPGRHYWYRFKVARDVSPVGRTKTAPAPHAGVAQVSMAVASCQSYAAGWYTAFRHMVEDDLDLVVHLGDYIYEDGVPADGLRRQVPIPDQFRSECVTLERYRLQYALYKTDPDLMAAHAAHPFIVTPDDHDVENNYAGDQSQPDAEPDQDPAVFRQRRAAAFQAFYENLPFRASQLPSGPDMTIHRQLPYGDLMNLSVLDTRQHRSRRAANLEEAGDPNRSMLGAEQERWLHGSVADSQARWQVIANTVVMARLDHQVAEGLQWSSDLWDGNSATRDRLFDVVTGRDVDNLVVLTGDAHQNFVNDLCSDFDDPTSVIGAEFVGTSICSGGDGSDSSAGGEAWLAANPHMKFYNRRRGYMLCTATQDRFTTDYRVMPYVSQQGAPMSSRASFVIEDGVPGAQLDVEGEPV